PVREGNLRFLARMAEGDQTGLFLDLREARRAVARYSRGRQVVNACSFTGTLSLTAAAAGSPRVVSVDASPRSSAWGRENFAANGLPPESHEFLTGDPAEVLSRIATSSRRFELALVEVPCFPEKPKPEPARKPAAKPAKAKPGKSKPAKGKSGGKRRMGAPSGADPIERFRRGYGELVRAAVSVLQPQGLLACGIHEQDLAFNDFLSLLRESAGGLGATLQVIEVQGLPPDFPVNPAWPRGRYLRFVLCAVRR
ncbi:MAG: class I SAM-dependent methyltransferase, partial [Planctomycetaceae bacterium]|nr:class I SAM-dependent methyltransferase [Planctomycetaceae bacterium]